MLFNSYAFILVYLPLTFVGFYFLLQRKGRETAILFLGLASLVFYAWWDARYVALLVVSVGFNYWMGRCIAQASMTGRPEARKYLTIAVTTNLLLLGYFKYADFFVDSIATTLGVEAARLGIVLPLGISFFTFTQIAFLVDCSRGEVRETRFTHYLLFVTYFPHLIAGPVLHHKEMMPQFSVVKRLRENLTFIAMGLTVFVIGLSKKVILADTFATHATPAFTAAEIGLPLTFAQAWEGAIAYTFQLYFDFSGYSDMAIGLSLLFGVRLPLNFNSPYRATSIIDFWRRWHMTLSRFLRDYVYFSLGGNRHGRPRRYINVFLTMLLGGLWHGAGWTYVVWGALHGIYLMINHAWRAFFPRPLDRWWSRGIARSLTLLAVIVGWVIFRAETIPAAGRMLHAMASLPDKLQSMLGPIAMLLTVLGVDFKGGEVAPRYYPLLMWALIWLSIVWYWPNTQEWMARFQPGLEDVRTNPERLPGQKFWEKFAWQPSSFWAIGTALLAICAFTHLANITEFLYFQF